ncbi:hypothetical protein ES703_125800 [subsurface metagenome]
MPLANLRSIAPPRASLRELNLNMLLHGPVLALPCQEGAGVTLTDISGFGNNGTFGAGAAAPSWVWNGYIWVLSYDGGTDVVNCGSGDSLDNLTALTYRAWVNPTDYDSDDRIFDKTPKVFRIVSTGELLCDFSAAIQSANSISIEKLAKGVPSLVEATYDDNGDKKIRMYINNTEVTYSTQDAAIGALTADAASNLLIGNRAAGDRGWDGYQVLYEIIPRVLSATERLNIFNREKHYLDIWNGNILARLANLRTLAVVR